MDGVIPVRKPAGVTSRQVVDHVRRTLGVRKAGHSGTLDPGAEGVLPVCLGRATRLADYLHRTMKTYDVELIIGSATDTQDAFGVVLVQADASKVSESQVTDACGQFIGEIAQVPPMHSACKHQGKRLYTLARSGVSVERTPRTVMIASIDLLRFQPGGTAHVWLRVTCGSGVYMRTLCEDIASSLGLPGHMGSLIRIQAGGFRLDECVNMDGLTPASLIGLADTAMRCLPAVCMTDEAVRMLQSGLHPRDILMTPVSGDLQDADTFAVLRPDRSLCAIVSRADGRLHPHCVFLEHQT